MKEVARCSNVGSAILLAFISFGYVFRIIVTEFEDNRLYQSFMDLWLCEKVRNRYFIERSADEWR